jgi:hypothetical protein
VNRECGDCSACCKLLEVGREGDEFRKPQGIWCPLIRDDKRGCTVHAALPKSCANFKCAWLSGGLRDQDRPDRARIVVSLEQSVGDKITDRSGRVVMRETPVWCVYEREPGAAWGKRARWVMDQLAKLTVLQVENGPMEGPFPTCIISGPKATRMMRLPYTTEWLPCYRPEEVAKGEP